MKNARQLEKSRHELNELLKLPENHYCADCGAKQPMWASSNIGVFLCIRCCGVHRNLGTHISKVKSVTLDMWAPEVVQHFKRQGGNLAVNRVYESLLPKHEKPTELVDTFKLEQFIRSKYGARKWYAPPRSENVSNSSSDKEKRGKNQFNQKTGQTFSSNQLTTNQKVISKTFPQNEVPDLLPPDMLNDKNEPEALLSFGISSDAGFSSMWTNSEASNSNNTSGFAFINSSASVSEMNPQNNDPNSGFSFTNSCLPTAPSTNTTENVDILDEPVRGNPKDTILSKYKKQEQLSLFQTTDSKSLNAFMTQLPPNLIGLPQPYKPNDTVLGFNSALGQTRSQINSPQYMNVGFGSSPNSKLMSHPNTILNQPKQSLF